jgi:hypothetical protein
MTLEWVALFTTYQFYFIFSRVEVYHEQFLIFILIKNERESSDLRESVVTLLNFNEKFVFHAVSAIRVQIWSGVDFPLVRWSLGWSSDFSSQLDSVFLVGCLVCILVSTFSRDSVPVRPAASCFSSSRPRHRSAALCVRVLFFPWVLCRSSLFFGACRSSARR